MDRGRRLRPLARSGRLLASVTLPYDMGNAGDLLKHGVLAEVVRWQCEQGIPLRFIDLFGGKPWGEPVPAVAKRVRKLAMGCTLRAAQTGIDAGRYYGSGWMVRNVGAATGAPTVRVLTTDQDPERRKRLQDSGLTLIDEDFPNANLSDAYNTFENDVIPNANDDDLVLIDPFAEFLLKDAPVVVPQMEEMARRGAVLLFALNLDPQNWVGRRFDKLLNAHLQGAWRLTCPPLNHVGVQGESRYRAEVVLAARWLSEGKGSGNVGALWERLNSFSEQLAGVLDLAVEFITLRIIGR